MNRFGPFPLQSGTRVRYFPLGEQMFDEMLNQLSRAEHFIFLEYFTISEGYMWGRILKILEEKVKAGGNEDLLRTWRRLQTSDHFYYMCTKWFADGDVHSYFNPYGTPYDAYINYMNVLADFGLTLDAPLPAAGASRS